MSVISNPQPAPPSQEFILSPWSETFALNDGRTLSDDKQPNFTRNKDVRDRYCDSSYPGKSFRNSRTIFISIVDRWCLFYRVGGHGEDDKLK